MKKFVVQSVKGVTSIIEVEYELMPKYYNYALKEGEWMGKITAPAFLYVPDVNNKLVPPVWCWWAFHDSVGAALEYLDTSFRESFVRAKEKAARRAGEVYEPYSTTELNTLVVESLDKVKVVML
jgi:hypothetical protein